MTKEELKNRVLNGGRGSGQSLRVLIEVYENKIVDLEQKNKDLADCNARLLDQVGAAAKRAIELEKENKELKETYKRLDNLEDFTFETYKTFKLDVKELARLFESRGYRLDGAYKENIKLQDQLTKATELLKEAQGYIENEDDELYDKIEQLLQEIEK